MSKKLAAKASLIQLPPSGAAPVNSVPETDARPKTSPGAMAHFMATQSEAVKEADTLRKRLETFDGATPVRQLDPATVRASRWANRHADTFGRGDFAALKSEIASAGGNVQPIKVRELSEPADGARYEVVFGHRRHRACLELGLPVRALVERDVSDVQLFEDMERENRQRKDLSAWEQGRMYMAALDGGLYPSNRRLADAIGRDLGDIGKALALARLPKEVVEAFPSPLDLQYRWSKPLSDALQRDPDGLLKRARGLKKNARKLAAAEVFEQLVKPSSAGVGPSNPPVPRKLTVGGRAVGVVRTDAKGRLLVEFEPQAIPPARHEELARLLEHFFVQK